MAAFYADLQEAVFGAEPARFANPRGKPRVIFQLEQRFSDAAPLVVFDFVVQLHQLFGRPLQLFELKDGCISVGMVLPETHDLHNVDFRYRALKDPRYHDVFRRFGVQKMYVHGFPDRDNLGWSNFQVDRSGQPIPQ